MPCWPCSTTSHLKRTSARPLPRSCRAKRAKRLSGSPPTVVVEGRVPERQRLEGRPPTCVGGVAAPLAAIVDRHTGDDGGRFSRCVLHADRDHVCAPHQKLR